jgi:hypothetical protein
VSVVSSFSFLFFFSSVFFSLFDHQFFWQIGKVFVNIWFSVGHIAEFVVPNDMMYLFAIVSFFLRISILVLAILCDTYATRLICPTIMLMRCNCSRVILRSVCHVIPSFIYI